ncbi:MAG: class I fructose-bisphosphate aldolase [bacterium]
MNNTALTSIVKALIAPGKGILAADESFPTIEKRFKSIGVDSTEENRRTYRELLFTTPGIEEFISGVILFDETLRQQVLSNKAIIPGIKVDEGMEDFIGYPGEKITRGLDGLVERLQNYKSLGAKFTKWRAVFTIAGSSPGLECVEENTNRFAEFALISQKEGFVPIVEPEVLMDGDHDIDKCSEITGMVLKMLFIKIKEKDVDLSCLLLKPNMILPGKDNLNKADPALVAQKTLEVLKDTVPSEVPGIVFLSGGQTPDEATDNLRELNKLRSVSWQLSFSFGRALQEPVLKAWAGKEENRKMAQDAFFDRAKMNSEARHGR